MPSRQLRLLLLTGGLHPFGETTPIIAAALRDAGHEVTVSVRADELRLPAVTGFDAIIMNSVRGRGDARYTIPEEERDNDFDAVQRGSFQRFVQDGGGLVSIHVSPTSCPDWPEMMRITGGGWVWGKSRHPPYGTFRVSVVEPGHPVAAGIGDFDTQDELYCDLDIAPGVSVFLAGMDQGMRQPLGWSHTYGVGRVVNLSLGHNAASVANPAFLTLVTNAADHVARRAPA